MMLCEVTLFEKWGAVLSRGRGRWVGVSSGCGCPGDITHHVRCQQCQGQQSQGTQPAEQVLPQGVQNAPMTTTVLLFVHFSEQVPERNVSQLRTLRSEDGVLGPAHTSPGTGVTHQHRLCKTLTRTVLVTAWCMPPGRSGA